VDPLAVKLLLMDFPKTVATAVRRLVVTNNRRHAMARAAVVLSCIFFVATLSGVTASLPRVGILHADQTEMPNLQNILQQYFPGGVGIWDGSLIVPPITWLQQYDALLMFSNFEWINSTAVCANVANYLDQGGRVVTGLFSTFTNEGSPGTVCSDGEFNSTYLVIVPEIGDDTYTYGTDSLGTVYRPTHAIMQGISNFTYDNVWEPVPPQQLVGNSYLVADWKSGAVMVAARDGVGPYSRSRVDLGFWPAPGEDYPDAGACPWTNTTSGACPQLQQLVINALNYTLRDYTSPSPSPASTFSFFWRSLLSILFDI